MRALCDSGEFRRLPFLKAAAVCPPSELRHVWRREMRRLPNGLTKRDAALLTQFGEALGTSDVAGQLALCEEIGRQLEEQREEARCQQREKSRLYQTLGLIGGLGAALLMI